MELTDSQAKKLIKEIGKILDEYDEVFNKLKTLPGGRDAFDKSDFNLRPNKKTKGYSNQNLNPLKLDLDDTKKKILKKKTLITPLDEDRSAIKLSEFIEDAKEYIRVLEEDSFENQSWSIYYFDMPIDSDSASLGMFILSFLDDRTCRVLKVDFEHQGLVPIYTGKYRKESYIDNQQIAICELTFEDKYLNIIGNFLNSKETNEVSGVGIFNQFDGTRIHSGRFLKVYIGNDLSLDKCTEKLRKYVLNDFRSDLHPNILLEALGSKELNYLVSMNWGDFNNFVLFPGSLQGRNLEESFNSNFIDYSPPIVYLAADISIKEFEVDHFFKQSDIGQVIEKIRVFCQLSDEKLLFKISRKSLVRNRGFSYHIYFNTGKNKNSLGLVQLGQIIEKCKRVLIIYLKGSLDRDFLNYIKSKDKQISSVSYEDMNIERGKIVQKAISFLSSK